MSLASADLFQAIRLHAPLQDLVIPNINVRNENGQSLLQEAIAARNESAARLLLRQQLDVNSQDDQGATALHYVALYQTPALGQRILQQGGNLALLDQHGNSPLWTAVFNARGQYDVVDLFLQYQADPQSVNRYGKTPADFATQIQDPYLMRVLQPRA
ncbi:hypothetical protein PK28_17165 (plasmid) [Hymenobacter sp. DG25B]|uniref:ankyrin repeat domain-containing protein n=1 Tax=Hymenobacter sp. DG25B TaxID=1385664 RepID=UPI00054106F1|nr:ankyrin repeat domain-containing protein [Hymenobacter sp. DG25B]AIZ65402.1 hypothetical protein PK28_17165 [Hymenobacter sp. DG25B]